MAQSKDKTRKRIYFVKAPLWKLEVALKEGIKCYRFMADGPLRARGGRNDRFVQFFSRASALFKTAVGYSYTLYAMKLEVQQLPVATGQALGQAVVSYKKLPGSFPMLSPLRVRSVVSRIGKHAVNCA